MKKIFRVIVFIIAFMMGLIIFAGVILYIVGNRRLNKKYEFPQSNIPIPTDKGEIEYGRDEAEFFCAGCHAEDYGGVVGWLEMGPLGSVDSANLTSGNGGVGDEYSYEDFIQALRHGIDPDGRPIYMPAVSATSNLDDRTLAAIVAYIKTVPPVNRQTRGEQISPIGAIIIALGMAPPPPVEIVTHQTHVTAPDPGLTPEYGKYLINTLDCKLCHGPDLSGANFPDPTVDLFAPNITSTGEVGFWTEEQFIGTLRHGVTPSGHQLDTEYMPWEELSKKLTDEEFAAIRLYLLSLP